MVVFTGVTERKAKKVLDGFELEKGKTIYETARFRGKGVVAILYSSGKLLLQGKSASVKKIETHLCESGLGPIAAAETFQRETGEIIGSDESLKGDTFGGIVVAAVKADAKIRRALQEIGVADSKTLSDTEIFPLAEKIRRIAPCEVKSILPEEYNQVGKQTVLLNTLHKESAHYLLPGTHVVDKYPGCTVGNVVEEKADSKYVEVAAASILARASALQQLNYLSKEAGFRIPKGSSHVKLALHELKERKLDPRKFVKLHFNNVKEFF